MRIIVMHYKLRNLLRTLQSATEKCIYQSTAHRVEIIQKKFLHARLTRTYLCKITA